MVEPENSEFLNDNLDYTTLVVQIEDVSLQDIASVVLSARRIKLTRGKKFPVYFELVYPKSIIEKGATEHRYAITASIVKTAGNELLYTSDRHYALPPADELPSEVTLTLVKVKENECKC